MSNRVMSKEAESTIADCTRDALLLVATRGTSTAADERFQRDAAETIERLCENVRDIVEDNEYDLQDLLRACWATMPAKARSAVFAEFGDRLDWLREDADVVNTPTTRITAAVVAIGRAHTVVAKELKRGRKS